MRSKYLISFVFLAATGIVLGGRAPLSRVRAQEAPAATTEAGTVLADVLARYRSLRSLRARFEQRYVHRLHQREERWRGRVALARPGRMRIDYDRPHGRVVVTDGTSLLAYDPEPAPGQYWEQPSAADALPLALGVLTGAAQLEREVDARLIDASATGFVGAVLELRPRVPVPLYERVLLYVDRGERRRGRVHRVLVVDAAGNTNRFDLRAQEENARVPPDVFAFRPPAAARRIEP